jgi:hypothetical protein
MTVPGSSVDELEVGGVLMSSLEPGLLLYVDSECDEIEVEDFSVGVSVATFADKASLLGSGLGMDGEAALTFRVTAA